MPGVVLILCDRNRLCNLTAIKGIASLPPASQARALRAGRSKLRIPSKALFLVLIFGILRWFTLISQNGALSNRMLDAETGNWKLEIG